MKEKWTHLDLPKIKQRYYLAKVVYDCGELKIIVDDGEINGKLVLISFKAIESYRYCNEHSRMELLKKLDENYEEDFYANYNLFKIENSTYIEWLNKSSYGITKEFDLQHYVFMDSDCVIDIISYGDPEFKDLN